jgi:hypothetical protein
MSNCNIFKLKKYFVLLLYKIFIGVLMSDIVVYTNGELELKISVNEENIWLNQLQMSELFETSSDNISLHLKNIYKEKELNENSTTEDFSVVRQEFVVFQCVLYIMYVQ